MTTIEENKDELKVPTIEEMYNADTPQGASLRKLYDFQNGMLVNKTEQAKGMQAVMNPSADPALKQALEPLNQAEKSYDDIIKGMVADRDSYQKETEAVNKNNEKVQFFGGLAETVAALTNLIGTTKGAVSQQWASPQQAWAQRADAIRKERDAKLQGYREQVRALEQAKNQVTQKKSSVISTYNAQKETTARTNARIQASADLAIAKAQEAAKVKLAKNGADGLKLIANNANRLLTSMIREYGAMGTMPSEANMKRWSELAYNAALAEYRDIHPEDFEDTILP